MRHQTIRILLVLVGIFLIISLSRDLQQLLSARERIEKEQQGVVALEEEQQELARELEYVMGDEFAEKEAREKLLMSKPEEVVVLLPTSEDSEGEDGLSDVDSSEERELANWEKWMRLFL